MAMLFLMPAGIATADNGDNRAGCYSGEICFWYNEGSLYEKQFWYNANHAGNKFMYFVNGHYVETSQWVQDNALDITNRDTDCRVFVGNYLGNGNWQWEEFPNNAVRYFLRAVNNRNDYHQRCGI